MLKAAMVREFPRTTATASTAYVIAQPRGLGNRSAVGPWVLVVLFVPFAPVITNLKKHSCKKAKNKQRKSTFCRGNLQSVNLPCFSRVLNSHGHANSTFSRLFSNNPFDLYWFYSRQIACWTRWWKENEYVIFSFLENCFFEVYLHRDQRSILVTNIILLP